MGEPMLRGSWNQFRLESTSDPEDGNAVLTCGWCGYHEDMGTFFPTLIFVMARSQEHMVLMHARKNGHPQ